LLITIESALAELTAGRARLMLDRSTCVLMPQGARAVLRTLAPASRVAMLSFHPPAFVPVARSYKKLGFDQHKLDGWLRALSQLPRTPWVHEIVHRYVFERTALGEHDNATTRFLETETLKEIYFLFRDREEGADRASSARRHSATVDRAIAHIEAHLFDECPMQSLAAVCGASESALLRAFHRELGASPAAYWRNRRLDEALAMVRTGRHSVGEIATRVGYDNPAGFTFAFRRRFGRPPSAFLPPRRVRPSP